MSWFNKLYSLIMGNHPNNTVFSFNYHNVRHLVRFFENVAKTSISTNNNVMADIGAGASPYYYIFSNKISTYYAIDTLNAFPINEQRNITQIPGRAEEIPLEDNSVDIVICNQVIEHLPEPLCAFKEINRVLKPGGLFLGSVPHISPIHLEPFDYWRFTEYGVLNLLDKANFTQCHVEGNGGAMRAAALLICMDGLLSTRKEGQSQSFHSKWALALFPLIGFINFLFHIMDRIIGNRKRSPANYCFTARKKQMI